MTAPCPLWNHKYKSNKVEAQDLSMERFFIKSAEFNKTEPCYSYYDQNEYDNSLETKMNLSTAQKFKKNYLFQTISMNASTAIKTQFSTKLCESLPPQGGSFGYACKAD